MLSSSHPPSPAGVRPRIPRNARTPGRLVALGFALASAAAAQPSPRSAEFQVNGYTLGDQFARFGSCVAADDQGRFVVVWTSYGSNGTDSDYGSIQAQRYAADGSALGAQFQVNTYTTGAQNTASVARRPQGDFVVVWSSAGSSGTDSDLTSIQGRRYSAGGTPLGGEFQVNSFTTGSQIIPGVAIDALGSFVVVWMSEGSVGTDSDGLSIQAQRYDVNGIPVGAQFQVNTYTTSSQSLPAVARAGSGEFVVTWASRGSDDGDTSYRSVQAQRFDAGGDPVGGQFQVNAYTTGDQSVSAVAIDPTGGFLVAWSSDGSAGSDSDLTSIQAQRFDPLGAPLGGQFQVNSFTTSYQAVPAVAADAAGRWIVTWQSDGSASSDQDSFSVQGRHFANDLAPLGGEFQINTYTTGYQFQPAVAALLQGDFVVAWSSDGSAGTDIDGYSVQARRYCGLFCDGFESGDTAGWSASVP